MGFVAVTKSVRERLTLNLFMGQSLFSAAVIATFTLTAVIAADLSDGDVAAGIPSTLTLMGRAIAAYPIGLVLDRAGRRIGLSAGFGFGIVGCVVTILAIEAGSFAGFCLGALLLGMGRAGNEQSRFVAAEIYTADKRAKVIGLMVFAGTLGAVFGPLLAAPSERFAVSQSLDAYSGPFLAGIALFLGGLLITMLFLRPDPKVIGEAIEAAEQETREQIPARPLLQIFQQPTVILAVAAMAIAQLVMTLLMVITPLHMSHYEHNTIAISQVISAHTLGMFALSGVTGWLIDRYGRVPLIIIGALILVASCFLITPSTAVLPLAVALFLLGLGWNFCFIAGSSLLSDSLAASERPRVQGVSEMIVAVSAGLAGLVTGILFAWSGMTAVAAIGLAFSLAILGFLVYYALARPGSNRLAAIHEP
jgi:MFS family permease